MSIFSQNSILEWSASVTPVNAQKHQCIPWVFFSAWRCTYFLSVEIWMHGSQAWSCSLYIPVSSSGWTHTLSYVRIQSPLPWRRWCVMHVLCISRSLFTLVRFVAIAPTWLRERESKGKKHLWEMMTVPVSCPQSGRGAALMSCREGKNAVLQEREREMPYSLSLSWGSTTHTHTSINWNS